MDIDFECPNLQELCSRKSYLIEAYGHEDAGYLMSTFVLLFRVSSLGSLWPPLKGFRCCHQVTVYSSRFRIWASETLSIIVDAMEINSHSDMQKNWESITRIKILSIEKGE